MSRYSNFRNSTSIGRGVNPFEFDDSFGSRVRGFSSRFVGNSWFDKFTKWIEELGIGKGLTNLWKGATGSGLTDRDIELNNMNMQNVEDTAEAQTKGYIKAGINPALMYGNGGQQTAPQSSSTGTGSLSDLMQVLMLPAQIKLMNAQAKNTDANTEKQISETEQIKQIMQFYPRLTEHTIAEITSRTGINLSNISKTDAEVAILEFEKIIKSNESKYSDEFYRLRNKVQESTELNQKASALQSYMQALWTEYETQYTKQHDGARPSSSSLLALADAVMSWLGTSGDELGSGLNKVVTETVTEIAGEAPKNGDTMQKIGRGLAGEPWKIKGKTLAEHGKRLYHKFRDSLR